LPPPDTYIAETSFNVRYAETDAMGIVHHASYIVYFEEGRSNYARKRGASYAEFEAQGLFLTVSEVNARYIRAGRYDQRLIVRCWLGEVKSRSVKFDYEIIEEATGELLVTGYSKHICINRSGQVTILPQNWRSWADS